ncbi:MAG: hypothetical protein N2595_10650, partial [bacterium]|nr:hypothetical protein [bacterium]
LQVVTILNEALGKVGSDSAELRVTKGSEIRCGWVAGMKEGFGKEVRSGESAAVTSVTCGNVAGGENHNNR